MTVVKNVFVRGVQARFHAVLHHHAGPGRTLEFLHLRRNTHKNIVIIPACLQRRSFSMYHISRWCTTPSQSMTLCLGPISTHTSIHPPVRQVRSNITTLYQTDEILILRYNFLVKKKKRKKKGSSLTSIMHFIIDMRSDG